MTRARDVANIDGILTTTGDMYVASAAATPDRLGVGANNTVLTADSTAATGVKWATAGASVATPTTSGTVFGKTTITATDPVAIGYNALNAITTGVNNTAVGSGTLPVNTIGDGNSAFGRNALQANVDGVLNCAFGLQSQQQTSNGSYNTSYGWQSLTLNTTGSFNTAIGAGASNTQGTTGTNNTTIGYLAQPVNSTVSNTVTLGNSSITTLRCQVTSITALSDARDKKNIESLNIGLDFVNTLKPVTFDWNMRSTIDKDGNEIAGGKVNIPDAGFIAQDIIAAEDATGAADHLQLSYRENPDALEITQGRLIPILVKAIQDLSANNAALLARIEALEN